MNYMFGQIFLYIAFIFVIDGLLISLFRRFKLADFIAHLLTGVLFALILFAWGRVFGPDSIEPFEDNFRITAQTLENLKSVELPDSLLGELLPLKDQSYVGEDLFIDSLAANIGDVQTNLYKANILRFSVSSGDFLKDFIQFLAHIGILLFFMQLGFNYDRKLFSISGSKGVSLAMILLTLNIVILGGTSYFFYPKSDIMFSLYLFIAFLSISIGAILAAKFPVSLSIKKPLRNLVQATVVLDLTGIGLFTFVTLYFHYNNYDLLQIKTDLICWGMLIVFFLMVVLMDKTDRLFLSIQRYAGTFMVLLKAGLFFLFLYIGYRVGISVLLLGFWSGFLLKAFSGIHHVEINQKLLPLISFFYIFPFAEVGRDLAATHWYSSDFRYYFLVIFFALIVISIFAGLMMIGKKEFPLIISLGTFPRGEITVLILWLFKNMQLISSQAFAVAVIVVIVTNLLGGLLARLFFVHLVELRRRLRLK